MRAKETHGVGSSGGDDDEELPNRYFVFLVLAVLASYALRALMD